MDIMFFGFWNRICFHKWFEWEMKKIEDNFEIRIKDGKEVGRQFFFREREL